MNTPEEVIATTAHAWSASMSAHEYGALLNTLLEAERAGAKLLSAYLDDLPRDSVEWKRMRSVQLDESRNCAVLIRLLMKAQLRPSAAVGAFYERGRTISGLRERLDFLNRGQAWVAKQLAAALPRLPDSGRKALQAMHDSHLTNIRLCEALL
jgi:hypothetical protein